MTQTIPFYTSIGAIAPFSSHGPTVDGRAKPDVASPGNVIVSSVNSFDANYGPTNPEVVLRINDGSNYWYFASMQGTSMSSPFTAGVVALMLQAKPNLQPNQVRTLFYTSSRQDSYTGNIVTGSNTWGGGKIDAYEAVWQSKNYTSVSGSAIESQELFVYPNPCDGDFVITLDEIPEEPAILEVYNINGQCIKKVVVNNDISHQNLYGMNEGIYFIRLIRGEDVYTSKLMLKH